MLTNPIVERKYPIGESGLYINPKQAIRKIDEWFRTTPAEIRNQQIQDFALGLIFIGGLLLLRKSIQNRDLVNQYPY